MAKISYKVHPVVVRKGDTKKGKEVTVRAHSPKDACEIACKTEGWIIATATPASRPEMYLNGKRVFKKDLTAIITDLHQNGALDAME